LQPAGDAVDKGVFVPVVLSTRIAFMLGRYSVVIRVWWSRHGGLALPLDGCTVGKRDETDNGVRGLWAGREPPTCGGEVRRGR
jgi:hypothetical protein